VTPLRISGEALEDLNEGFLFYEAQAEGLGDYFTSCLRADIEALKVTAGIHRVVFEDVHRALSRVFPYGVFYTCDPPGAVVWAVVDLRRDPLWIHQRLMREKAPSS